MKEQMIRLRAYMIKMGKKAAGNLLDGKIWQQIPER